MIAEDGFYWQVFCCMGPFNCQEPSQWVWFAFDVCVPTLGIMIMDLCYGQILAYITSVVEEIEARDVMLSSASLVMW